MNTTIKKRYVGPTIEEFGTVSHLTAALGTQDTPDQSEFPEIPASTGSNDICINDDPNEVC